MRSLLSIFCTPRGGARGSRDVVDVAGAGVVRIAGVQIAMVIER